MHRFSSTFVIWPLLALLFAVTVALTWGLDAPSALLARPDGQARVEGGEFPKTLVDAYGQRTRLEQSPRRIISGMLAADEILLELLPKDRLLAVTRYATDPQHSNCVAKAQGITQVQNLPLEGVLSMRPDLVLVGRFTSGQVIAQMRQCHVPVFCLARFDTLADIRSNVELLGAAVGAEKRADRITRWMDGVLAEVRRRTAGVKRRPRVLYYHLRSTQGKGTIFDELVRVAGGINVAAEAGIVGYKSLSAEMIPALNPDVVIVPQAFTGAPETWSRAQPVLLDDPVWQTVRAAQERRVYGLPSQHLDSISHHVVKAAAELAAVLHPDRFPDPAPLLRGPDFGD